MRGRGWGYGRGRSRQAQARRIPDERFHEPLTIEELARSLYVSPEHLRKLFRGAFGSSPLHYLIRKRIEYAKEMLAATDRPIHEVAQACGIDNPYYFSRLFKRVTGATASEHRARARSASS